MRFRIPRVEVVLEALEVDLLSHVALERNRSGDGNFDTLTVRPSLAA